MGDMKNNGQNGICTAICDDSREDLERIKAALSESMLAVSMLSESTKNCTDSEGLFCACFQNADALKKAVRKNSFDLFLLDIEMPDVDGFALTEQIFAQKPDARVIFVSNHDSFIWNSQKYMPLYFVRKSRLKQDMSDAVRLFWDVTRVRRATYQFKNAEVFVRDILYIECDGHLLRIQTTDKTVMRQYGSLKAMESDLAEYHFLRIHKSILVNPRYIMEIGKEEIRLSDGTSLPLGRDRRKAVQKALLAYRNS